MGVHQNFADPRMNLPTPKHVREEETDSPGSQENVRKCPRVNASTGTDQPTLQLGAEPQYVQPVEAQYAEAAIYDEGEDWREGHHLQAEEAE